MKYTQKRLDRWRDELKRLQMSWRWGECRRFQSNGRKIERREWLIGHITEAKAERRE